MNLKNNTIDTIDTIKKINLKSILDRKSLLIVILIVASLCISVLNVSGSISPSLVERDLEAGECYTVTTNVTIPTILQQVDVVFAFDLSFSMANFFNTTKLKTEQVMNTLITSYPGINFTFGVMSHMDYPDFYSSCGYGPAPYGTPDGYAYSLDQPLTDNITTVTTAINSLISEDDWTADAPEDYTRIFYESYNDSNIGWRTETTKLLVNFGDNVPHDCNLNENITSGTWSTGGDPGRDEIMGNSDDLDLQTVLADMNSSGITLIECHTKNSKIDYWTYWTGITGGSVYIINSSNFDEKVKNAITGQLPNLKVYNLTLNVTTPGYESWLTSVDPPIYSEVTTGTSVTFNETICVPIDTPSGLYIFNVSAVDEDGVNYSNQTNVINVNEPPVANNDSAITNEDTAVWINVTENDNDNDGTLDLSTVNITSGPSDGIATVNTTTGEIQYTPDTNFYGPDSFTYEVDDDDGATSNVATVNITVGDVNDPPVITTEDDTDAVEDELYSVDYNATDDEGDTLTWSLDTNATFLSITSDTGVLSGTPVNADVGSYWVNVSVDDGNVGSDFSNFTLTVLNVNDPPNTPSDPDPDDGETDVILNPTLSVYVSDPDGDTMEVSFYNAADDSLIGTASALTNSTASVTWSGRGYSTTYSWYAIANDSLLDNKSDPWSFTTKSGGGGGDPPPSYYSPTADPNGPYYGFIGEEIEFDGTGSHDNDENGESIEKYDWKFFEDNDWHEDFGPTPTFIYNESGDYTVTLRVYDDENSYDVKTTTVHISQPNYPPTIITAEGPTTGDANTEYTYTVNSTDLDANDTIIYTFNWGDGTNTTSGVLASNTSFNTTHSWSTYGAYTVTITAEDSLGSQDVETITVYIDVLPIDDGIKGYLVDEDSDDTYDSFDNTDTGEQTDVEQENSTYLIDSNGDGKWDHAYNLETGLSTYYDYVYQKYYNIYQQSTPGFEVISVLAMIALVLIILRRKR